MPQDEVHEVAVQADDDNDETLEPHADRMTKEMRKSPTGLVRSLRIHSTCGMKILQVSSDVVPEERTGRAGDSKA